MTTDPGKREPDERSAAETLSVNSAPAPDSDPAGSATLTGGAAPAANAAALRRLVSHLAQSPGGAAGANQKYQVKAEIGRGGMGLILRVEDLAMRRHVAMKVLLAGSDPGSQQRFVEEGRITGRLEHPNIVPVHDIGVDAEGRQYFTMKLVKGRSLAQVLDGMRKAPQDPKRAVSLAQLLTIYSSVCNAISYAHSRGVIHRDLKPANIMIDNFGEVLVMDWGLAKDRNAGRPSSGADNLPNGGRTMEGSAIGTPAYMPPEQARGELAAIDERSDVYMLGAILYELLTLKTPVEGENIISMLGNVLEGKIVPPGRRTPERRIPGELSAIAMKALALAQKDRYQNVAELSADVERYLEGRAVSARDDTPWEYVLKLIKRNRTASLMSLAAMLALIAAVAAGYWLNAEARARAEQALARLEEERQSRRNDQIGAAPAFVGRAEKAVQTHDFDAALQDIGAALNFDPELAPARMLKAQILISQKNYGGAAAELQAYLKLKPDDGNAKQLSELCEQARSGETLAINMKILDIFFQQQAYVFAEAPGQSGERLFEIYRGRIDKAWKGLGAKLQKDKDGQLTLDIFKAKQVYDLGAIRNMPLQKLYAGETSIRDIDALAGMPLTNLSISGTAVRNLDPLQGLKIESLNLSFCREFSDLSPLEKMPLTWLNLHGCWKVRDLSPLAGMPLSELHISKCAVSDLSPLAGMSLKKLIANRMPFSDISVLKGMPLDAVNLSFTKVSDLTPLQGAPLKALWLRDCGGVQSIAPVKDCQLEELDLAGTRVTDLSLLRGMKLKILTFTPKAIAKGIEVLRAMDSLREVCADNDPRIPAEEFWKKYDAGAYRK